MSRNVRKKLDSSSSDGLQGSLLEAQNLLRQAKSLFQHRASDSQLVGKISTAINAIDDLALDLSQKDRKKFTR